MMDESTTILVTQLDSKITEKQLSDFFSFCGKIESLSVRRKKNGEVESVLQFGSTSAAETALLLSNAIINDKAIIVVPYTKEEHEIDEEENQEMIKQTEDGEEPNLQVNDVPIGEITQRPGGEKRTATATIASIIASGYVLGLDALNQAKKFDEEKNISTSVASGTNSIKEKASQLDEQYQISNKASATSQVINDKWQNLDQQYAISEKGAAASATISGWGASLATGISSAFSSPQVQDTLAQVQDFTNNVGTRIGEFVAPATNTISTEFQEIKELSAHEIEEKRRQREGGLVMEELSDFGDISLEKAPVAVVEPLSTEVPPVPVRNHGDLPEEKNEEHKEEKEEEPSIQLEKTVDLIDLGELEEDIDIGMSIDEN